jgi:hypothetical protein
VRYAVGPAKLGHLANAQHGQTRLRRSGLIVKAGVQDAAIMRTLVPANGIFLLENRYPQVGQPLEQPIRRRQADDAAAYDDYGFGLG